jgi:hypothetical protein
MLMMMFMMSMFIMMMIMMMMIMKDKGVIKELQKKVTEQVPS